MPDVFLSYNREDLPKAKLIATALQAEGFDVWWDTVLRAGETYDEVTEKRLRDAKSVVVLWSSRSVRSKWVRAEATLGDRKAALIPVMIEACDRPIMFELIQTADLTQWQGNTQDPSWRTLVDDVRAKVGRGVELAPQPPTAPTAPDDFQAARTDSIETAYWMSVKDGADPSEFESYLHRYPQGHFAELARKRIDMLKVPKPEIAAPTPVPPRPPVATRKSSGNSTMMILGLVVAAFAAASAVMFWPHPPEPSTPGPVTAVAPEAPAAPATPTPAEPVAPAAIEPAPVGPPVETATFRDCPECPEMKHLTGGAFWMGSPKTEQGRREWEGPQREIQLAPFAISLREISFDEWDVCANAGACPRVTDDRSWGRGTRPVLKISWNDARAYVAWLSARSGRAYRLPSEAEWEYAARGGTTTAYWWGDNFDRDHVATRQTLETGKLKANGFGLFDVTGNVAEWVEDCYLNDFSRVPADGSASTAGDCNRRVVRGGSWHDSPRELRIASRSRITRTVHDAAIGLRVAANP